MQIESCASLSQWQPDAWNQLIGSDYPFAQHGFLSSLEDSGCVSAETGWQPAHHVLKNTDGELLSALPFYLKSHSSGEYVFDWEWANACQRAGIRYYPKGLCAIPFSPVQGPRLLGDPAHHAALIGTLEDDVQQGLLSGIHINFTGAAEQQVLQDRPLWLPRTGCQFHWYNAQYRDFQDFLDRLTSRKRKQFRKERQQVEHAHLQCEWRQAQSLSEAEWDFIYTCYSRTYYVRRQAPYLTRDFFSLLAQRLGHCVSILWVTRHAKPVAMALFLQDQSTLYGRYWGCIEEVEFAHFEACLYQGIERAISLGLQCFDAGAQGEHKLIRGFEPVLTESWHYLGHEGLRNAVANVLSQEHMQVLEYAAAARQALPYKMLDAE